MEYRESVKLFLKGKDAWNAWAIDMMNERADHVGQPGFDLSVWEFHAAVDFQDHVFARFADFSEFLFPGKVILKHVMFSKEANFAGAKFFGDADFSQTKFEEGVNFSHMVCEGNCSFRFARTKGKTDFQGAKFKQPIEFSYARFHDHVDLSQCETHRTNSFVNAKFHRGMTLEGMSLLNGNFTQTEMPKSNLFGCDLSGANFEGANLTGCNLLGAQTDTRTQLRTAIVNECKIDRYALDCLENFGGLSHGALMRMDIRDDTVVLRKSYSGWMRWAHLVAVIAFFFPYVWFALLRWSEAKFLEGEESPSIYLITALARFVFNGGQGWDRGFDFHWTFVPFVIALLYNAVRLVLLAKTTNLEFHREITGFAPLFSMTEVAFSSRVLTLTWKGLFEVSRWGAVLFLLLVFLNGFHFLTMEVPVAISSSD